MKIRSKLTFLVGTAITGGLAIAVVLLVVLAPILKIQEEQKIITELKDAENALGLALLSLPQGQYNLAKEELETALDRATGAFESLNGLERLPNTIVSDCSSITIRLPRSSQTSSPPSAPSRGREK